MGRNETRFAAVKSGAIDATLLLPRDVLQVGQSQGPVLADIGKEIQLIWSGAATSSKLLAENRGLAERFLTGAIKGREYARRFKEQIKPMDAASEAIYQLNPVTFHYNKAIDPTQTLDFGLIAEEVAEVDSELVGRNQKGEPESVRYEQINAMLLNEFLKEHRKVKTQTREIQEQQAAISKLKKEMASVVARFKDQDSKIEKMSAQMQISKCGRQIARNNP